MKELKNILSFNIKELVLFQLFFKLSSFLIFTPLFLNLFTIIMKVTGYSYLTLENIISFLINPLVILLLLLLIIFMLVYTFFDLSTIIILLDASYQRKKVSMEEVLRLSFSKSLGLFHIKNILFSFVILFLIPFLHIGVASCFISSISIPEFIMDFINNNLLFRILFWSIFILFSILLIRWIYCIHYYVLENCDFKKARGRSISLGKSKRLKDYLSLLVMQGLVFLGYFVFLFLGIGIIYFLYKVFFKFIFIGSVLITILWIFLVISLLLFFLLSVPLSYACISMLFYRRKKYSNERIKHIQFYRPKRIGITTKRFRRFKVSLVIVTVVAGSLFTYGIIKGKYNFNIEYIKKQEITAHRGSSCCYPENTMEAFIGARVLQADWIELDVCQTKDGYIVVSHDNHLKRTLGIDNYITNMTYEEIRDITKDGYLPLLKDVIEWASFHQMRLNIELKDSNDRDRFIRDILSLIDRYSFLESSVIASFDYNDLENIKEINNQIQTVYIMSLAYGDILSLDKADIFSIEASSITNDLVRRIHNGGKEVYAWTVNSKDSIYRMLDLNVDNIITDDVSLAYESLFESRNSNLVFIYIKFLSKIFK